MNLLQQGYQLQQQGQFQQAQSNYQQVLKHDARNIHALNLLGMLAVNQGQSAEAIEWIQRALSENPNDPQAHANIGLAYKDVGQMDKAVVHLQAAIKINPDNPVAHNNLGNVLREIGNAKDAVLCFENALQRHQQYPECWSNLASALNDLDDFNRGLGAADKALSLDSNLPQAHNVKGEMLRKLARFEDALVEYDRAIQLAPDYTEAMISQSDVLRDLNRPNDAVDILQKALAVNADNPFAYHALGVLHEQLGQRETAATNFKKSLQLAPTYASAYYQLAQLKGRVCSDEELAAMEALWQQSTLLPEDKKLIAFALFRVFDSRGEVDTAYHYLAEGNRIKAQSNPYSDKKSKQLMENIVVTAKALKNRVNIPAKSEQPWRPVFVLGMPRSGTTLTEQILASHSQVSGAGEVSYAFDCARLASSMVKKEFPDCVAALDQQQIAEVGDYYRNRHAVYGDNTHIVIDKTPLNFQYIGLLAQAIPEALFIHCHRNPVDNCFAIHRIPFDERQTYAHSLESLGQYYSHYQHLMTQWKAIYGERILDVCYEDTVADVELQSRRMLEFVGVDFEAQVLEFYKSRGLVKTPSASQVREPIYKDSVQAWKKYEKHLGPLIEHLSV